MLFTIKNIPENLPFIKLNYVNLEQKTTVRFLGLELGKTEI